MRDRTIGRRNCHAPSVVECANCHNIHVTPSSSFRPGDHVHVASFGKGVVREVRNGGRYLVELKGRSMVVTGSQLTAAGERKRASRELPDAGSGLAEGSREGMRRHRSTCTG